MYQPWFEIQLTLGWFVWHWPISCDSRYRGGGICSVDRSNNSYMANALCNSKISELTDLILISLHSSSTTPIE